MYIFSLMFTMVNYICYKAFNVAGGFDLKSRNSFKHPPAN